MDRALSLKRLPAVGEDGRLRACPRCAARRWALVEQAGGTEAACLSCGLGLGDPFAARDDRTRRAMRRRGLRPRLGRRGPVRWIAHAGLAASRPGGTPDRASLQRALDIGVDAIELDVCVTWDGRLVVRHDVGVTRRHRVSDLTLRELRDRQPETLMLSEAVEQLGGRVDILVDPKDPAAARPLSRWLRRRRANERLMVCSPDRTLLLHLREEVPHVERWQSVPGVGPTRAAGAATVMRTLMETCAEGRAASVAAELGRAGATLAVSPRAAAWHVVGSPWRRDLPSLLGRLTQGVHPAGISVDHRLISPQLCLAARRRRLQLMAWTINAADHLRRALDSGIGTVTTDRVVDMRLALLDMSG
ncbi:MAG TPA: glycerophosphodiester phosphodiesterase family protein [Candidatus Dormibacteraeota bacterium]